MSTSIAPASQRILITGVAGFIGMHTAKALLEEGYDVYGIDNLNPYYDPQLKKDRIAQLREYHKFDFEQNDIINREEMQSLFERKEFTVVIHLAAQAGVRYSLEHPYSYIDSNLVGFGNILEYSRRIGVKHLIYGSSSSVYGRNKKVPFSEKDAVNLPASLYAATKLANELMAESYHHLFHLPCTGLRFFTVYGPWGRPDMAYFSFTRLLYAGEVLPVYNQGHHRRDMTYIDDILKGILAAVKREPPGHRIYNLGNNKPVELLDMIRQLELLTGKTAILKELPFQDGDVLETYADIQTASSELSYHPKTDFSEGLARFIDWYNEYYRP